MENILNIIATLLAAVNIISFWWFLLGVFCGLILLIVYFIFRKQSFGSKRTLKTLIIFCFAGGPVFIVSTVLMALLFLVSGSSGLKIFGYPLPGLEVNNIR